MSRRTFIGALELGTAAIVTSLWAALGRSRFIPRRRGPALPRLRGLWPFAGIVLGIFVPITSQAQEIWQQPEGVRCIERWIQETGNRLNGYQGSAEFNGHKPWRINQYGLFVGTGISSASAPDDWGTFGQNKYAWMWGHYTTEEARPDWNNQDFYRAGVSGLRYSVRACFSGSASPPPTPGTATPGAALDPNATCPPDFSMHANSTLTMICYCASSATVGSVWGTDVYTTDSSLCAAALHAGATAASGGMIRVQGATGRDAYAGTSRNGVQSADFGNYAWSFYFPTAQIGSVPPGVAQSPSCPGDFLQFRGTGRSLSCHCSPDAMSQGRVWGTDVYTDDSSVCRAALHAGVVASGGGPVTVVASPGRSSYDGLVRNGVSSVRFDTWDGSFSFRP